MALATISSTGAVGTDGTSGTLTTNNTSFSLTSTQISSNSTLVVVFAVLRSATVSYTTLSSTNVDVWYNVGTFSFATNTNVPAQTITVFVGQVIADSTATVTATASASITSIAGGFSWRDFTTSSLTANTSWVVEAIGSSLNTTSAQDMIMPTLVPQGANRAYIGYADAGGSGGLSTTSPSSPTYTLTNDGLGNQWVYNLAVSGSQSPFGRQASGTNMQSDTVGLLLRAYEVDTSIATTLNIGTGSGQNHFDLDTAFASYTATVNVPEASMVSGWNTVREFCSVTDNYGRAGVQFMVNVDAPTTSGSTNPRTELRELDTDGLTQYGFNPQTGTHYLRGRTKVTNLMVTKPTIVWAQCHNASSDIIALVTQLNSGTGLVELLIRINGTSSGTKKMSTHVVVGDEWDWMIQFTSSGYWAVYYHDLSTPHYDSTAHAVSAPSNPIVYSGSADCYFKTGCYANSNTSSELGDTTQFGQIELRFLQHWHTGWPTPSPAIVLPPAPLVPVVQSTPLAPRLRSSNW